MKALRFDRLGDLHALRFAEAPAPDAGRDRVRVRVAMAGLNPSDVKNVLGRFSYTTLPRGPGRDFAGVVDQGPPELVGREVCGTGKELGFTSDGSHAEYMTLPATGVAPRPRSLSFALCAASGVPYTTALNGLERTAVTAGTRVLVIGLGAVGKAAVDIARWMGARVACAVRRDEHLAYLARRDVPSVRLGEPEAFANAAREPFADAFDAGALPAPPEPAIIPFEAALPAYGEVHGGRPDKVVFAMGGA